MSSEEHSVPHSLSLCACWDMSVQCAALAGKSKKEPVLPSKEITDVQLQTYTPTCTQIRAQICTHARMKIQTHKYVYISRHVHSQNHMLAHTHSQYADYAE